MMSALAQPFVSLKSWLTREDELATPSPVADENLFTTRQDYNRFSDLLPWTGYWETEKLFAIDSIEAIGYAIEMNPQTGATDDMARLIQEIYRDMPAGAGVQVQLWGSPDIDAFLNNFKKVVRPELLQDDAQRSLIARMTAERSAHYRKASLVPPVSSRPSVMRRYRVLLSVTMPVKDVEYRTLERIIALRDAQVSKLKTYYQFERVWEAEDLMSWVRTMLNPAQHSADPVCYDDGQALRYQMITRDTVASVGRLGITLRSPERGCGLCACAFGARLSEAVRPASSRQHAGRRQ